jgi:predicted nucleic acid-binding protein
VKGIADTGFLVAFGSRRDRHHRWAIALAEQITEPLLTCDAVLAEASFHLASTALVLEMVEEGLVRPAFVTAEHIERLGELARQYKDRKPDLADLCIIRLSELFPRHPVLTVDVADFSVYRRNKRYAIPLIFPPEA